MPFHTNRLQHVELLIMQLTVHVKTGYTICIRWLRVAHGEKIFAGVVLFNNASTFVRNHFYRYLRTSIQTAKCPAYAAAYIVRHTSAVKSTFGRGCASNFSFLDLIIRSFHSQPSVSDAF